MKNGKHYFISTFIIGILCVPALGEIESSSRGTLLGQAEPALKGIKQLYIIARSPTNAAPVSHGITFEELENYAAGKIEEANIVVAASDVNKMEPNSLSARRAKFVEKRIDPNNVKHLKFIDARIPELRIDVDSLDIKDSNKVVFYVKISLARLVYLGRENQPSLKTEVWQSEPIMRAVPAEGMSDAVTSAVLEQVEVFTHAHLAANSSNKRPLGHDTNKITTAKEKVEPAAESTPASQKGEPAEHKYAASKNGTVFHKPDCIWVKRIKPENLVYYSSRDEAINAGKKPCKLCNP